MSDTAKNVTPRIRRRPLAVEFYRRKSVRKINRKWSWRLNAGNGVNWASPSKGFSTQAGAVESFDEMVKALGGDPSRVVHKTVKGQE